MLGGKLRIIHSKIRYLRSGTEEKMWFGVRGEGFFLL